MLDELLRTPVNNLRQFVPHRHPGGCRRLLLSMRYALTRHQHQGTNGQRYVRAKRHRMTQAIRSCIIALYRSCFMFFFDS